MKDINLKVLKSKTASAVISINGNEYEVNSEFAVLNKVYNEMYGTDLKVSDMVKRYLKQCQDQAYLQEIKQLVS